MSDDKDYFFILYMVYVGINVLLASIALLPWPGAEQLELVNKPEGYQATIDLISLLRVSSLEAIRFSSICTKLWILEQVFSVVA